MFIRRVSYRHGQSRVSLRILPGLDSYRVSTSSTTSSSEDHNPDSEGSSRTGGLPFLPTTLQPLYTTLGGDREWRSWRHCTTGLLLDHGKRYQDFVWTGPGPLRLLPLDHSRLVDVRTLVTRSTDPCRDEIGSLVLLYRRRRKGGMWVGICYDVPSLKTHQERTDLVVSVPVYQYPTLLVLYPFLKSYHLGPCTIPDNS